MVALRRNADGTPMCMITLVCPECRYGVAGNRIETAPPKPGMVPYCPECLARMRWVVMRVTEYLHGPPDLRVS